MSKEQIIQAIRRHNRTASPEFLLEFNQRVLEDYLQRLTRVLGRRGRGSYWVRQTTGRSVVTRAR